MQFAYLPLPPIGGETGVAKEASGSSTSKWAYPSDTLCRTSVMAIIALVWISAEAPKSFHCLCPSNKFVNAAIDICSSGGSSGKKYFYIQKALDWTLNSCICLSFLLVKSKKKKLKQDIYHVNIKRSEWQFKHCPVETWHKCKYWSHKWWKKSVDCFNPWAQTLANK